MNSSKLFQQLLSEGKQLLDKNSDKLKNQDMNLQSAKKMASGFGGGLASGGILGAILGSKKGRSYAGKAAKVGSVAALGGAAYYAYQKWQSEQKAATPTQSSTNMNVASLPSATDVITEPELQCNTDLLLDAMIGAAKADGHVDAQEHQAIISKLSALGIDQGSNQLIEAALTKPLDPAGLAARVTSVEQACEVYLISYSVIDVDHFMEKAYLQELEKHLNLPATLIEKLKQQI
ncbi:tellurite resistance TerB family protein [Moritella sp. 24]|uniref:tellurite resistance TerB family protein n=1 Tax=Moritella sp. 24 TaxID=2746230 RepID=UPI001BAD7E34|nr:tellurite resistance TerB family protein [Moritella sp. 24]QUM75836.1 tellurite resistance TerB family protein [Moritella sp. 24]